MIYLIKVGDICTEKQNRPWTRSPSYKPPFTSWITKPGFLVCKTGLTVLIFLTQREFWKWYSSFYKKRIIIIITTTTIIVITQLRIQMGERRKSILVGCWACPSSWQKFLVQLTTTHGIVWVNRMFWHILTGAAQEIPSSPQQWLTGTQKNQKWAGGVSWAFNTLDREKNWSSKEGRKYCCRLLIHRELD